MSAHLATPPYGPYPGAARYGDYYWMSAGSTDSVPAEEAPGPDALPLPAAKTPSPSGTCPAELSVPGAGSGHVPGAGMLRAAPARLRYRRGGAAGAAGRGASVATAQRDGPKGRTEAPPRVPLPRGGLCPSPHGYGAPASPHGTRILNSSEKLDFKFF